MESENKKIINFLLKIVVKFVMGIDIVVGKILFGNFFVKVLSLLFLIVDVLKDFLIVVIMVIIIIRMLIMMKIFILNKVSMLIIFM